MKTLKNILTTIALLVTVQFSYGQLPVMKAPVSFKLKSGMTVIVAENTGTQKVFSNLSFEGAGSYLTENAPVQELVNTILSQQLPALYPGLSLTDKGINLVTTADQFEEAMAVLSAYVSAPEFTEPALEQAKAVIIAHLHAQDKYYPVNVTAEAIRQLNVAAVKAYYTQLSDPATAFLTVAGNIKPSMIKSYTRKGLAQPKTMEDQPFVFDGLRYSRFLPPFTIIPPIGFPGSAIFAADSCKGFS